MNDYIISTQEYKFLKGGCDRVAKNAAPNYCNVIHMDYSAGSIIATTGRELRYINSRDPQPDRESMQFIPELNKGAFKKNPEHGIRYMAGTVVYPDYTRVMPDLADQRIILRIYGQARADLITTLKAMAGVANCEYYAFDKVKHRGNFEHGRSMVTLEFISKGAGGHSAAGEIKIRASVNKYGLETTATLRTIGFEVFNPKGDTLRIAFNVNLLADLLQDFETGELEFRLEHELAPLWIIQPHNGSGALLMPVRLPD